jgi:signal transduction histidine kinase
VQIIYAEDSFRLRIRDDGIGMEPEALARGRPGHWGLKGMPERARKVGAVVNVWSAPAAGTEIELTAPAATAYFRSNAGWRWLARLRPAGG